MFFIFFWAFLNVTERRLTGYLRKDSKLVKETCKAWERSARCCGSGLPPTSTAASTVASRRRYETMSRNPDPHHTTPNPKNWKTPTLKKRSSPWSHHFLPPSPTLGPTYGTNERKWEREPQIATPEKLKDTREREGKTHYSRAAAGPKRGKTKRKVESERRDGRRVGFGG